MWHEARKQERLIRGMLVDYRRRAERRRDFYEKINADSTQILQVHGRQCKIHLEPAIAAAGDSASIMMPWQGDHNNIIDRFDVRAHLDFIPEVKVPDVLPESLSQEERNCNYERYRILAQNLFLGISEEKFLHTLAIEEQFGITMEEKEHQKEKLNEKKGHGASIGYNYDNPSQSFSAAENNKNANNEEESEEESDVEMIDVDLSIDVNKVEPAQAHAMNTSGTHFGMLDTDLFSFLTGDAHEAERHKQQMREEKEKALFSGRKSRRQRRAHRDKLLATRVVSPPHYAARPSPVRLVGQDSPSPTRSPSPEPNTNTVTYITSFGGDDDLPSEPPKTIFSKMSYADKVKVNNEPKTYASVLRENKKSTKRYQSPKRRSPYSKSRRSNSRSRSSRSRRSRSRSLRDSRTRRSKPRYRSRSRNRSRSYTPDRRRSYSSSSSISRDRSSTRSSRSRKISSRSRSRSSSNTSSTSSNSSKSKKAIKNRSNNSNKAPEKGNQFHPNTAPASSGCPPRYYGRKREGDDSSSELSLGSSDEKSPLPEKSSKNMVGSKTSQVSNVVRSSGSSSKQSSEKLSLKERLRRKMQAQLSRQLRADKKAEAERLEREQQMQQERDDEMREMAIKIRRRQREMRHQRRASYSSRDSSSSSSGRSPHYHRKRSQEREDSRKKYDESPPRKRRESRDDNRETERSRVGPSNHDEGKSHSRSQGSSYNKSSQDKDYDYKDSSEHKSSKYRDDRKHYSDRSHKKDSRHKRGHSSGSDSGSSKPVRRLVDY